MFSGKDEDAKPIKPEPTAGKRNFNELMEYFERGKVFTEELMKENERLRFKALQLEKEKMDIKARIDIDRFNEVLEENRNLRTRLESIENKFGEVEKENMDFAQRYVDVQTQNDALLNLYVSSYQLHSTLDTEEVVKAIEEIILNLIGAQEYFIYMLDMRKGNPVIVAGEGPGGHVRWKDMEVKSPVLARVLESGDTYFKEDPHDACPYLACTPLKVKDDVVGAISITKLMDQKKDGFTAIDVELLSLLSDHAATALVSSDLYNRTERKLKTVEGFLKLLKQDNAQ